MTIEPWVFQSMLGIVSILAPLVVILGGVMIRQGAKIAVLETLAAAHDRALTDSINAIGARFGALEGRIFPMLEKLMERLGS